ncbi:uncharacterized protein LOC114801008 [Denticeps clupeoides]|uniref:uncharacterized protein LOC114801008 n=1 Tax=Denticeps clupeoides TaxID=299321 RepID=UPI0010A33F8B|nr:uncharacterized protein LOC114801008 [Denticeps clupeoides]
MEEVHSIGSESPCNKVNIHLNGKAVEPSTSLPATLSLESRGNLLHSHHVLPLEAIREVDEAKEVISSLRSPEDGEVRVKLQAEESQLLLAEGHASREDAKNCDSAAGIITGETTMAFLSGEDKISPGPQADECDSSCDASDPCPSLEDSPTIPVHRRLDLESHSLNRGAEPLTIIRDAEPATSTHSLIEVLSACKTKVEQLEQLKCSSSELAVKLQSAQATAAQLQRQMAGLEEEAHGLREQLQQARSALQERSAEAARAAEELRLLRPQPGKDRPSSKLCALL